MYWGTNVWVTIAILMVKTSKKIQDAKAAAHQLIASLY